MTFEVKNFKDKEMFAAINTFIETDIAHLKYQKSTIPNYRIELTNVFQNIDINTLTKESFRTIVSKCKITVITVRFIAYLCNNGYISTDNTLMIFNDYISLFTKTCPNDRLLYLLSIDNDLLKKYISLHPVLGKCERSIIQANINSIPFVDMNLYEAMTEYIDSLKLETFATVGSLQNRIFEVIHICEHFLSKYKKEDITRYSIANALSMEWIRVNTMTELNKAVLFLLNKGLIVSNELRKAIDLKESTSAMTLEKYQEIMLSDDIQGYFIREGRNTRVFYAKANNEEILDALIGYAKQSTESSGDFVLFLSEFGNSLFGLDVRSIRDLEITTFVHQINHFKSLNKRNIFSFVTGFYAYVVNSLDPNILDKDNLSGRIFQKNALGYLVADGYDIIKYNPIESVPSSDKWIFCYSSEDETNSMVSTSNSQCVDFTVIQNETYRNWYKYYIWKNDNSLYTRLHTISPITVFFNYIDDLKKGKELSIYTKTTNDVEISLNEIIAYKNYIMNTYDNNRTRSSHIYAPRVVLKFVHDEGLIEVPNGVYYYLTHKLDTNYDNTKAVPDEHLKQISELMKEKSIDNVNNAVFYLAFYIALETEFRSSQLFALKADCVADTAKKGEYVLVSKTKTSANEEIEQPITIYVKKHIDEILKLTQDYRDNSIVGDIASYLFITTGERKGTYKILSAPMFNAYLGKCCEELNLPKYTYNNLRDTHMTKAEEFIIRNQMSDMEQGILSGHRSPNTDTKHYIDTQIRDLLESVHGVIIGNVDIAGQIKEDLPNDIAQTDNAVSNNCGYCGCKNCNDFSFLDCMLCKDFVTTLDRLPYFEEQVKILNEKIKSATIPHDKEDLVNMKRLHLGFISKILELKAKKGGQNNATN